MTVESDSSDQLSLKDIVLETPLSQALAFHEGAAA